MNISTFKQHLQSLDALSIVQTNGELVAPHFHITEVGLTTKHFIDCGGEVHTESRANLQVWVADDLDHRLTPQNLLKIIALSDKILGDKDLEIEVEYQTETIGKYALDFEQGRFVLQAKATDCLAPQKCNIPQPKQMVNLQDLVLPNNCTPGSGCC